MAKAMNKPLYEAEIHPGLEALVAGEVSEYLPAARILEASQGRVLIDYEGPARALLGLKTVIAVYSIEYFHVPRPKALLGHEHWKRLYNQTLEALRLASRDQWKSLHLSAAGADSTVLQRLRQELADQLGLQDDPQEGDLWIRLRRHEDGWQTLVRLSPRPLVTRAWRVANLEGALNASVAHAMLRMLRLQPSDCLLSLCAGSGTFLVERSMLHKAGRAIGVEWDDSVLAVAQANLAAWGDSSMLQMLQADARSLPLPKATFSALCADLPFGQRMGSTEDNEILYPSLLKEAARVAQPGARFVILTHAVRLMQQSMAHEPAWHTLKEQMIVMRGLHPRIYLLERR